MSDGQQNQNFDAIKAAIQHANQLIRDAETSEGFQKLPDVLKDQQKLKRIEDLFDTYGSVAAKDLLKKDSLANAADESFKDTFNKSSFVIRFFEGITPELYSSLSDGMSIDRIYNEFNILLNDWLFALDISRTEIKNHLPEIDKDNPFANANTFLEFLAVMQEKMLPALKADIKTLAGRELETDLSQSDRIEITQHRNSFVGLPDAKP